MSNLRRPLKYLSAAVLFAAFFVFFYLKYVPLVPGFQAFVLGSGLAVLVLAAARPETGTLAFLLLFPLVNAWPYLFRIDEHVPHAPAALVLFLFYLLGRLVGRAFGAHRESGSDPIRRPIGFFAGLVAVSAAVTFWRFSGFFPFVADRLYEYPVNVTGVSAGGARMSVVFVALNLLGGMTFYALVRPLLRDAGFRRRALSALAAGLLVAAAAGLAQKIFDPRFGNTAFWADMHQINGTFKDPNAFGAVLSMFLPLLIAAFFREGGKLRPLFGAAALLGLIVFPFIGSRSPLLGLGSGLLWIAASAVLAWKRAGGRLGKTAVAGVLLAAALAAGLGGIVAQRARLFQRLSDNVSALARGDGLAALSRERYFLWREALAMARDYPVSGVGAGAYILELPNYYAKDTTFSSTFTEEWKRVDSAENLPLHLSAELGLTGLLALLWLLAALVLLCGRVLRVRGRDPAAVPRDRLLLVAAAAGLLSFGLNALFHSFIGTFETTYAFWFLAAFLAASDGRPEAPGSHGRRARALAALGVLAFGAVLAWDAGHSLSPGARWKTYPIKREFGLYPEEKTADGTAFRWTRAYGAYPLPENASRISVPVHAGHPDIASRPVDVELTLVEGFFRSKVRLGGIRLADDAWRTVDVPLPARYGPGAFLLVTVGRTWIPLEVTGAPDPRELGVAVGALAFAAK